MIANAEGLRPLTYFDKWFIWDRDGTSLGTIERFLRRHKKNPDLVEAVPANNRWGRIYRAIPEKVFAWLEENGIQIEADENQRTIYNVQIVNELTGAIAEINSELKRLKREMINIKARLNQDDVANGYYSRAEILSLSKPHTPSCGIYFLIKNSEIVYVGQSVNVKARVDHHRRSGKDFDRVSFIGCSEDQLDLKEAVYIRLFDPELNGTNGNAPKGHVDRELAGDPPPHLEKDEP